jgi:tRNA uridine 5-carboxymethylaminomethyl modification enzyme
MFTSRAEYRLLLRHDNADRRLTPLGYQMGVVGQERWKKLQEHEAQIEQAQRILATRFHDGSPLERVLRRPDFTWADICALNSDIASLATSSRAAEQIVLEARYAGYIRRQQAQIEKQDQIFATAIPDEFNYAAVPQLRAEAKQKFNRVKPRSLGQASRISGITPTDISILVLYIKEPQRLASHAQSRAPGSLKAVSGVKR